MSNQHAIEPSWLTDRLLRGLGEILPTCL